MTEPVPTRTVEEALDAMYAGMRPDARKRGRNPRWPYVPLVLRPRSFAPGHFTEEQIKGRAFETREAAVTYAEKVIAHWREASRRQFLDPRYAAFRRQWGVEL